MILLAWTINHGNNNLSDHYALYETLEEAKREYTCLCEAEENLHCAAISKVLEATEPHWEATTC